MAFGEQIKMEMPSSTDLYIIYNDLNNVVSTMYITYYCIVYDNCQVIDKSHVISVLSFLNSLKHFTATMHLAINPGAI